jgi:hypothetical protein
MFKEDYPETKVTAEFEGGDNPISARVIDLVKVGQDNYKTETGLYHRQTHSKIDGTHYVVAYNPHEGSDDQAECFLFITPTKSEIEGGKYRWVAVLGPNDEDIDMVEKGLASLENILEQDG